MPDVTCTRCGGSGFTDKDGTKRECLCSIERRIKTYLGVYNNYPTLNGVDVLKLDGKCILVPGCPQHKFMALVKTFLIAKLARVTFMNCCGNDMMEAYLSKDRSLQEFMGVGLLLVFLAVDPPNRRYDQVICSVIGRRKLDGKQTWVWVPGDTGGSDFTKVYGPDTATYLANNMVRITNMDKLCGA